MSHSCCRPGFGLGRKPALSSESKPRPLKVVLHDEMSKNELLEKARISENQHTGECLLSTKHQSSDKHENVGGHEGPKKACRGRRSNLARENCSTQSQTQRLGSGVEQRKNMKCEHQSFIKCYYANTQSLWNRLRTAGMCIHQDTFFHCATVHLRYLRQNWIGHFLCFSLISGFRAGHLAFSFNFLHSKFRIVLVVGNLLSGK